MKFDADEAFPVPTKFSTVRCTYSLISALFQVPVNFSNNWNNYYLEIMMLAGITAYILNYVSGKSKNQKLATAWWVIYTLWRVQTLLCSTTEIIVRKSSVVMHNVENFLLYWTEVDIPWKSSSLLWNASWYPRIHLLKCCAPISQWCNTLSMSLCKRWSNKDKALSVNLWSLTSNYLPRHLYLIVLLL